MDIWCMRTGTLLHHLFSYQINHVWLFLINALRWELMYDLEADVNVNSRSFSLAFWQVCLSWLWDMRCLRVLHISRSNALLSKHQRELTNSFRPPQDVIIVPNVSPTGPREAQAPSQKFIDSSLSAITSSPTLAAYVNSRISIKEVTISIHMHIYSYTLCTQLHISHVHGL